MKLILNLRQGPTFVDKQTPILVKIYREWENIYGRNEILPDPVWAISLGVESITLFTFVPGII